MAQCWVYKSSLTSLVDFIKNTKRMLTTTKKKSNAKNNNNHHHHTSSTCSRYYYNMYAIGILVSLLAFVTVTSGEISGEDREVISNIQGGDDSGVPWFEADDDDGAVPLSRRRRSVTNETSSSSSIWDDIEEFYSDKNNMAMYCVLPIMVLIYGGCASIYCIHKCRQYFKRKNHKRLKEEFAAERNDLNQKEKSTNREEERPISQISQAWTDIGSSNDNVKWSGHTEANHSKSPLPWQVNEKSSAAAMMARNTQSRAGYVNDRLQQGDNINMEEGHRGHDPKVRSSSRTSTLDDTLIEEEMGYNKHSQNVKIVRSAAANNSDNFGESTDDSPNIPLQQSYQNHNRQDNSRRHRQSNGNDNNRREANLNDYVSRSSKTKATDYSRFAEAKPIEIVPLSADPSLRVWDPLHRRPWGEKSDSRMGGPEDRAGGGASGHDKEGVNRLKEEMLARYDALSTFQMAKKAAAILQTNAVEKSPFQRKPNKKKHIFIAE